MWYLRIPSEVDAIIDKLDWGVKKKRKISQKHLARVTLSARLPILGVFSPVPIWFLIIPRAAEWKPHTIMKPLCSGPTALMAISSIPKETHSMLAPIRRNGPVILMQYVTPAPNFPRAVFLGTWKLCFVIKQPLQAAIMHTMYGNVAGGPRREK